jgi:chromosome segregation ATPase
MPRTTKRYQDEIKAYQEQIDSLTLEVTAAKMENERLLEEIKALEQGRDEQDENWQQIVLDAGDRIRKLEARLGEMQDTISYHQLNCLPEFKNYISLNEDVSTTER